MSDRARGLFRGSHNGNEFALIEHTPTDRVEVTRAEYERMQCEPPYDDLPTKEVYQKRKDAKIVPTKFDD